MFDLDCVPTRNFGSGLRGAALHQAEQQKQTKITKLKIVGRAPHAKGLSRSLRSLRFLLFPSGVIRFGQDAPFPVMFNAMAKERLIVFVKAPRLGLAKTRI